MKKQSKIRAAAIRHGWRSGLEEIVGVQLKFAGIAFEYEPLTIPYLQPEKSRKYTPDFVLGNGIIIETKGRFVTAERQKILMVMAQYPLLDLRIAFSHPKERIAKKSKTTYTKWCENNDILWCGPVIPGEWLTEPRNLESLNAIEEIMEIL